MAYVKSPEIAAYGASVIQVFQDRFEHLAECRIGYLFTDEEIKFQQKVKAGFVIMPSAMGQNRTLYEWTLAQTFDFLDDIYQEPIWPDVIMVINQESWEQCGAVQRVMLVTHELMHIGHTTTRDGEERYSEEDGRPIFTIIGHDVEEFEEIAQMFGTTAGNRDFAQMLLKDTQDPRVKEVLKMIKGQTFPVLPRRPPPPLFKCSKCEKTMRGKIVQGWAVIPEKCPDCQGEWKPVHRGKVAGR